MKDSAPEPLEAYLLEYETLRSEIDSRTSVLPTLVTIELGALGGGLSVFDTFPDVTLALAVVSTFLWLIWIDQANQVRKITAYVGVKLAPIMRRTAPGALGWEAFLRELDKGGKRAADALELDIRGRKVNNWKPGDVAGFTTPLFGLTTPALLVAFAFGALRTWEGPDVLHIALAVGVVVLWLIAVRLHFRFIRTAALISDAILAANSSSNQTSQ